jgi:hypothetical protein
LRVVRVQMVRLPVVQAALSLEDQPVRVQDPSRPALLSF